MEVVPGASAASPAATEPVQPAAAAAPAAATAAKLPSERLSEMTPEQRLEWRKTGQVPDAPAASSAATAVQDPPAGTPATSEPASEPADDDPDYKPKTKKRIQQLLEENRRLKDAQTRQPAQPAAPAASAPAPAASATKLEKPDPDKFQYGTADPAYLEALTDYKVKQAREDERAEQADAARKAAQTETMKRIQASWKERVAAAKVKHADFEAVALATDTKIPQGSLIDSWILESEHGADVLYELQKNPAEVDRLLALSPLAQTRELVKLELQIAGDQPKIVTSAPEPGDTLTARGADPLGNDPVRRAIKKKDAGAYIKEANERDLAARRRK